ncbi:MAG: FliM/FliN family flagellar motor switch protein [Pseudomonadota bacterium]
MNLAQTFIPARPLAQHCRELMERGPRPEERAEHLAIWRRDVAREVALDMAELLSGTKLEANLSEAETIPGEAVFERIGPVAANCLLRCGRDGQTALLSLSLEAAIALTDRSFGGSGEPAELPATSLPRSAAMLVEQVARVIAQAIARVSAAGAADESTGDVIVRSESASRLKPFAPLADCAVLKLDLKANDGVAWHGLLAMPLERLDAFLPGIGSVGAAGGNNGLREEPNRAVLGAVPLSLEAVLAEFELSLSQLGSLAPGDNIPLTLARDIPLRIGSHMVACGSLGTMEDRLALRVTSIKNAPAAQEQSASGKPPEADDARLAARKPVFVEGAPA